MFYCRFYFTCDRSFKPPSVTTTIKVKTYKRRLSQLYDKTFKKSCKTYSPISIILKLITCSQSQHTVQSMNIHSSPVIVSGTAPTPANERNDRLANAWWTIAGKDPRGGGDSTAGPTDRQSGHTDIKGVAPLGHRPFPCKFYCSCNASCLLHLVTCSLQVLIFNFFMVVLIGILEAPIPAWP